METSRHVLIIDDEADICEMLKEIFEYRGFSVSTAGNGFDAVAEAQKQAFLAALVDLRMPGMTGAETIIKLKEIQPDLRCIVISAHLNESVSEEAFNAGASAVFAKPVNFNELFKAVESAP